MATPGSLQLSTESSVQMLPSDTTTTFVQRTGHSPKAWGLALAWSVWRAAGFSHGFMASMAQVWLHLCHFHKLYLGTDKCGPIHVDKKMQPEPAERCLGKGFLFQFQTTHTCTVNKCSGGYWSTTFVSRPKALLSSALFSALPPPAFLRTIRLPRNIRGKLGGCLFGMLAHSNKRNLEVF